MLFPLCTLAFRLLKDSLTCIDSNRGCRATIKAVRADSPSSGYSTRENRVYRARVCDERAIVPRTDLIISHRQETIIRGRKLLCIRTGADGVRRRRRRRRQTSRPYACYAALALARLPLRRIEQHAAHVYRVRAIVSVGGGRV